MGSASKRWTMAIVWSVMAVCLATAAVAIENEGQDKLDRATDLKLTARSVDDLANSCRVSPAIRGLCGN